MKLDAIEKLQLLAEHAVDVLAKDLDDPSITPAKRATLSKSIIEIYVRVFRVISAPLDAPAEVEELSTEPQPMFRLLG
ncbi:hypothetical protein PH586_17870 [Pseudomonas sp. SA3-5]|uniref:Uncharacterized protein n=1 Tax=Pseudomonas aestuarii TaxID=3018340 RepID=A0ABT4XJ67_9PSED|nr:hypothetical protein [Pseudomonas aestuarii]MDA7088256.1 hypothetical protein [Pseudomonas aestuarii]